MEKGLPSIVLRWVREDKISLAHLPDNSLEDVRKNAAFLQGLCGLTSGDLGKLLFSDSTSKSSQQTLTVRLLKHGDLEDLVRVASVLGFSPSLFFNKDLGSKVMEFARTMKDPSWEESVFSVLPTCAKCGVASVTATARFCANCGKKL